MSEIESWLERYEQDHRDLANPLVFWAAVPMIVLGTVGVLWYLPVPFEFYEISPLLNWGTAFLMATAIYYFIISLSLAIGMLPFLLGLAAVHSWLALSPYPQLAMNSTFPVNHDLNLSSLPIHICDDFLDQRSRNAFLEPDVRLRIVPHRL